MFILAENIRVFAEHGPTLGALGAHGREYLVQLRVQTDFGRASREDHIEGTVNYVSLHLLAVHAMRQSSATLENACHRILQALTGTLSGITAATVRIEVPSPPLQGPVARAFVEMDLSGQVRLGLEDARFFALHGMYEEEGILGNRYSLDLSVHLDGKRAAQSDDLAHTVNYESLHSILRYEMGIPSRLLERVGQRIREQMVGQFPAIEGYSLRISKLDPPVPGQMGRSGIQLTEHFVKNCPRCKKKFSCSAQPGICWCRDMNLTTYTAGIVREQYRGCVCRDCWAFYEI